MESIDRLLAEVKTEYQTSLDPAELKTPAKLTAEQSISPTPSETGGLLNNLACLSEDSLIAEIKKEYEEANSQSFLKPAELQSLPSLSGELLSWQPAISPTLNENVLLSSLASLPENNLLADLQSEYEEEQKAEELKRQQQLKEEQLKQEKLKQEQREALNAQAKKWLKNLDPLSDEGLWFEEFAYKYPSKLEAAIDYLEALQVTNP